MCFLFTQKRTYEMRISDWRSDVCSSDLLHLGARHRARKEGAGRATGANRLLQRKGEIVLGLRDHEIARPARARMWMAERRWGWSTNIGRASGMERVGQYM